MLRNEYFVKPLSTAIDYKKELNQQSEKQENYKLLIEQLEQDKEDLYIEMFRLEKGFSYLICFKELIDYEREHPSVLFFWDAKTQKSSACKANAQGICEMMDIIKKNPNKIDINTFRNYYLPYLTNESTRFKNFEGLAVGTLKRELEEAAKDLYLKNNYTLGAEYATSWPSFDNDALFKLEEAKALTGRMNYEVEGLRNDIKIVKEKVRFLQRGFSYLIYFKDLIEFERDNNPSALQYKDTQAYDPKEVQTCETNAEKICTYMHDITKQSNVTKQLLSDFADLIRNYSEFKKIKQFMVFHKPEHEHLYKLRKELVNDAIKLYKEKGGAGGVYIEEPEPDELTRADREWSKNQENDNKIRASFEQGHNDSNQQVKKFYNAPGAGIKTRARVGDSLVTSSFGFSGTSKKDLEAELVKSKKELAESNKELAGLKIIINKARIALFWQYKDLDKVKRGNRTETKAEKEDNEYMYQLRLNKIFGPDENFDKQYLSLLMDETNYKKIVARNEKFLETLMEEGKKYQETFTKAI